MTVPLKDDQQARLADIKPRVYLFGVEARALVDKTFNKLQQQGCLVYIQGLTLFNFSIFVIWILRPNRIMKGQAVLDIKRLNKLVVSDTYTLILQSNIIASVRGCTHLAILDTASFFYQQRLHPDFDYIFTLVAHCGQEIFQVPIIGYINSIAYVQKKSTIYSVKLKTGFAPTLITSFAVPNSQTIFFLSCASYLKFLWPTRYQLNPQNHLSTTQM